MSAQFRLMVLHGPNLNMLGERETQWYQHVTIAEINDALMQRASTLHLALETLQTNHEANFIDAIHQAKGMIDFFIINAGAWTHTSIAIRDALLAVSIPFIEVHLSNVFARETFRHHSYLSDIALGQICGLGFWGYHAAVDYANHYLREVALPDVTKR